MDFAIENNKVTQNQQQNFIISKNEHLKQMRKQAKMYNIGFIHFPDSLESDLVY